MTIDTATQARLLLYISELQDEVFKLIRAKDFGGARVIQAELKGLLKRYFPDAWRQIEDVATRRDQDWEAKLLAARRRLLAGG